MPFRGPSLHKAHGACSVQQVTQKEPVICCPNRMYGSGFQVLEEISCAAFGSESELVRRTPYDTLSPPVQ